LVLIRAINKKLELIPDREVDVDEYVSAGAVLDPFQPVDEHTFELRMNVIRVLRNNLMVDLGRKDAKYAELYPGGIAHPDTLNRVVTIQRLKIIQAHGNHAAHESMHQWGIEAVPVGFPPQSTNLLEGLYLTKNISKAPFADAHILPSCCGWNCC